MGQIDQKPAETYLRWVDRLNRQLPQGTLPQNDTIAISTMVDIFQTTGHYRTPEVFAIGLFALGNAFRMLGENRISAAFYAKAIDYNPKLVPAHYNLGNYHLRMQRFRRALACYGRALKIEPENYLVNVNLAAAHCNLGDWQIALPHLINAIHMAPDNPLACRALSNLCQLHGAFTYLFEFIDDHPHKDTLRRIVIRNLQIGYFPPMGLHGVYVELEETGDLDSDYSKAQVVGAIADATSTVLRSPNSAGSFRTYLTTLDTLETQASLIEFPEAQFAIHFLRSQVYAGQCLDAFTYSAGGADDIMQEPIAFLLNTEDRHSLFGSLSETDFRKSAWKELDNAFLVAYRNRLGKKLNQLQLSGVVARNLIHLSSENQDVERTIFYIEATRTMLQQTSGCVNVERFTQTTALRSHLKENEALVLFYYYEIVVDILLVVLVTSDRVESFKIALDFTKLEGLEPQNFLKAHREGIESVTARVESAFFDVLVKPLLARLAGTSSITFVPYSYLRNIPIHLVGGDSSLWNRSSSRTYRYLPSLRSLSLHASPSSSARRCIVISHAGESGRELKVTDEIAAISKYFDDVVVCNDFGDVAAVAKSSAGNYMHVACHCEFDPDRREFFLKLKQGRRYIKSGDLRGCLLAHHVFLNACGTGRDVLDHAYGDSMVSLANVFFRDPVQTVVATFWPVADSCAVAMAEAYYNNLFNCHVPDHARALLQAQQELSIQKDVAHREDWGAYFVIGDR
ncbi:MAG: CHAT domain-containing protein [Pirellulales bacterium]|nr:CHAT domain-containing protein [Pirellulales bacterium]